MIIEISKFLHVPFLIIPAEDLNAHILDPHYYITQKLMEKFCNDIEKASAAVVVLCNVNHLQLELQSIIAYQMRGKLNFFFKGE